MHSKSQLAKTYFRVLSIFLFCTAIILFEIFVCQYSETSRFEWECMTAAIFNLGVSLLLRTYA